MPQLTVQFFGKPQIWVDGEPLESLVSQKARAALFYLAAHPGMVSRSQLAGLLWSDMEESAARANLRVVISKLKPRLSEFLIINRREIGLDPEKNIPASIDQFLKSDDLRQIANGYKGPFLNGFDLNEPSLFADWIEVQRAKCQQKAIDSLAQLASAALKEGAFVQSIADLRQLLLLDPWREEAHRQLMLVYARSGDRGAALSQYEKCTKALNDGLDIEPSAETKALFEQIKGGEIGQKAHPTMAETIGALSHASVTPNNLPTHPLNFIGRSAELDQVVNLLSGNESRLVTLTGTGGIGKTRLGIECGQALLSKFESGVFFVSLISHNSVNSLPLAIINELELAPAAHKTPKEQLLNYIRDKSMLLVLDNFEHLLKGIDLVLELLETGPELNLLVTSREPLGLAAEWVLPLKGLPFATHGKHEAATLFVDRAKRLDLSFSADDEQPCIHKICNLVEGLPLALELASAWIRVISCNEIAAEIEGNIDILETDLPIVPDHQRSIRAVFAYSWSLLTDPEKEGFSKLAIFRGGFDRSAAEKVAGVNLRTLTTLIDKSLLQKESGGRYRIHPLLQEFGLEQLPIDQKSKLVDAFGAYYSGLLSRLEPRMYGAEEKLLQVVDAEFDNVQAVFNRLIEGALTEEILIEILPVASYYYTRKNLFFDGQALIKDLIANGSRWSAETQANLQVHGSSFDYQLGHFAEAFDRLNLAIPVLQQADMAKESAEAFYYLGIVLLRRGDYKTANKRFKDSLSLFETIEDQGGVARALNGLAILGTLQGDYAESRPNMDKALSIHRELGFKRGIANLLSNIGTYYVRTNQHESALPVYLEAADIAKEVGEPIPVANIQSNIASLLNRFGRHEESIKYYENSLSVSVEMGDQRWIVANYNGLGKVYIDLESYEKATEILLGALEKGISIDVLPDALTAVVYLGQIALETGFVESAAYWLIYAVNHASVQADAKLIAEQLLAEMAPKLSDQDRQVAIIKSENISVEELKNRIKQELKRLGSDGENYEWQRNAQSAGSDVDHSAGPHGL